MHHRYGHRLRCLLIFPPGSFEHRTQTAKTDHMHSNISHNFTSRPARCCVSAGIVSHRCGYHRPIISSPNSPDILPVHFGSFALAVSSRFTRHRFASLVTGFTNFTRTGIIPKIRNGQVQANADVALVGGTIHRRRCKTEKYRERRVGRPITATAASGKPTAAETTSDEAG